MKYRNIDVLALTKKEVQQLREKLDSQILIPRATPMAEALDQIAGLGDPGADRILFWDESANSFAYLEVGSGLAIVGSTLSATAGGSVTAVNGTPNEIDSSGGATPTLSLPAALTFTGKTVTGGTFNAALVTSTTTIAAAGNIGAGPAGPTVAASGVQVVSDGSAAATPIGRFVSVGQRTTNVNYGTMDFFNVIAGTPTQTVQIAAQRDGANDAGGINFVTKKTGVAVANAMAITGVGNFSVGSGGVNTNFGGGERIIHIQDRDVAPTSNSSSGGFLYSETGELKWRNQSGVISALTPVNIGVGALTPVARTIVSGGAVTSVTFSGLDLDAAGTYIVKMSLKNATGSASAVSMTYNADTTATNYRSEVSQAAGSSATAANSNNALITSMQASGDGICHVEIRKPVAGCKIKATSTYTYDTGASLTWASRAHEWVTVSTNVTSITFTGSVASSIANDSVIEIYKLTFASVAADGFTEVIAASDQDIASSTALTNDNELFFTMTAGSVYEWELKLKYSSPVGAGTPDMKFDFTGPATLTGNKAVINYIDSADGLTGSIGQGSLAATGIIGTAAVGRYCYVRGWAASTAGGVGSSGFIFRWSQNTSNVNPTRRHAGSMLRWRKIGS